MNKFWIATIGSSLLAYVLKIAGHSIPAKYLTSARLQRVNGYIPTALLSALVAVQAFANKHELQIDHRALGLAVGALTLKIKLPFPIVVGAAAFSSAVIYRLTN